MKMRNKGKVHPSPAPSSSSSSSSSSVFPSSPKKDAALSVLNLLPATILALAAVLSLDDRQVLAYMITRSIKSTNPSVFPHEENSKSSSSKSSAAKKTNPHRHKTPLFDCDCFDCYTSFWFKWDSSPNRELIHQAIEAFEETHLMTNIGEKSSKKGKNKRKEKPARRPNEKVVDDFLDSPAKEIASELPPENDAPPQKELSPLEVVAVAGVVSEEAAPAKDAVMGRRNAVGGSNHKGLARKVLPDVLGLFNSRLWRLWSPNA